MDYQFAIQDDPLLSTLGDIIIAGWPDDIKRCSKSIMAIPWTGNSLTVGDRLILHGETIIVPL